MTQLTEKVDVVIVGSGAAGGAMAAKLAAGGKKVVILEAGPDRGNPDLISSGIWARRQKWHGEPVEDVGPNSVGYGFNAGYGTGGGAMAHYGVWPRFHEEDFDMFSRFGKAFDWPIRYTDLQRYYDQVQIESGVAGDAEKETWRPPGDPYPMLPVPRFAQGKIIAEGFEKLGMHTAPLPLAVTTTNYNGRDVCIWDGWCDAGCPIGALANPITIDLPKAYAHGAVLQANSTVTRILTNESGEFATGVEYHDAAGDKQQIMADMVVLAAFTVQNPRLMLASANKNHPAGLGNSSGNLGKYLMSHPAGLVYGLFDEPTFCYYGAFGGQLVCQDGYKKDTHSDAGAFGSYQWMIAQAVKPNDLLGISTTRPDLFGDKLHTFMKDAAHGFASMTAVVEDLPVAENAITLSENVDRYGVPLARISHTTHEQSKLLWQAVLKEGQAVFNAAGAREVWTGPQAAMHIIGGTRMGDDPASSVCNSYGQTHDIPNLVVAGAGLFPTSAGVNPTFTIHAVTVRSSEHLLNNWNAIIQ